MGITSSWSKGERLDHLDQNRLDGAVYWTEIGFSTYFDIPISSESYIFISSTASQVFIFSSHHIFKSSYPYISSKIWDGWTVPADPWVWSWVQLLSTGEVWKSVFHLILICSLPGKPLSFKHLQTTMNHQQCQQETQMEVWFPLDDILVFYFCNSCLCILMCCISATRICVFWGANLKLNDERRMQEDIIDDEPINLR